MTEKHGWGEAPPPWIVLLANAAEQSTKAAVAKRLGISRSSVSLLLANKYPAANTHKMQAVVEAGLGGMTCPVLGEISASECQKQRETPFSSSNPTRIALYRACQRCPHNPKAAGEQHAK
ncbi:MAG: hypothetical protein ACPGPF_01775 [Pontibacterium sp.]